jgi:hypothetical protein
VPWSNAAADDADLVPDFDELGEHLLNPIDLLEKRTVSCRRPCNQSISFFIVVLFHCAVDFGLILMTWMAQEW